MINSAISSESAAGTAMLEEMLDEAAVGTAVVVGIAEKRAEEVVVGTAEVGMAEKMADMDEGLAGRERALARKTAMMRMRLICLFCFIRFQ